MKLGKGRIQASKGGSGVRVGRASIGAYRQAYRAAERHVSGWSTVIGATDTFTREEQQQARYIERQLTVNARAQQTL